MILSEEFAYPLEDGASVEVAEEDEKIEKDNYKDVNDHMKDIRKKVDQINGPASKIKLPEPNKLDEDLGPNLEDVSNVTMITSLISALIKDEWEAIDGYNQAIVSLSAQGENKDVIDTLNDIIGEEYVHIGQLEKTLQGLIPEAEENMSKGEDEAEEEDFEDEEESEEDDDDESEDESEEDWPEDDIPMEIANKINFDKGDEEEDD